MTCTLVFFGIKFNIERNILTIDTKGFNPSKRVNVKARVTPIYVKRNKLASNQIAPAVFETKNT